MRYIYNITIKSEFPPQVIEKKLDKVSDEFTEIETIEEVSIVDPNHPLLSIVEELGFPIVTTLGVAGGMWFIVKWLMNTLERDIQAVQDKLSTTQADQMAILVKLIDRVRALEDSVTRVEVITRTLHDLNPDWNQIGRSRSSKTSSE